jgi:hypothetical protein
MVNIEVLLLKLKIVTFSNCSIKKVGPYLNGFIEFSLFFGFLYFFLSRLDGAYC